MPRLPLFSIPMCAYSSMNAGVRAGLEGVVVPKADLHLADVGGADHQHTKAALTDAAAHGEGQLAGEQHLVEGELPAVVAAGDR